MPGWLVNIAQPLFPINLIAGESLRLESDVGCCEAADSIAADVLQYLSSSCSRHLGGPDDPYRRRWSEALPVGNGVSKLSIVARGTVGIASGRICCRLCLSLRSLRCLKSLSGLSCLL